MFPILIGDIHRDSIPQRKEKIMNAARRKKIQKAIEMIADARAMLEEAKDEEQDAFDNMPESIQYSERGETMEEYIDSLEEAISSLEDVEELEDSIVNG